MKKWIAVFGMTSVVAFANGEERGNGGKAMVCRVGDATTVELLDVFEGRDPELGWNLIPDFGTAASEIEKAKFALERMERVDPDRKKRYLNVLEHFFENT